MTPIVDKGEETANVLLNQYDALKNFATGFFRYWWNQKGNNTDQGFDSWMGTSESSTLLKELLEQLRPIPQSSLKEEPLKDNKFVGDLQKQLQGLYDAKYKILESGEPNELFRSFYSICEREGKDTNWPAITARIKAVLELQHTYAKQSSLTPKSIRDSEELEELLWQYGNDCAMAGSGFSELPKPKEWLESRGKAASLKPNKLSDSAEVEKSAEEYAERVCNGGFPIEYTREQVVRHTKGDFIEGWKAKEKSLK